MKRPRGLPYISVLHACRNNGTDTNRTSVTIAISSDFAAPTFRLRSAVAREGEL
jgi:hypothetical protein